MSKFDLTTAQGRRRAVLDYLWADHAYLRLGFQNAHWVSDELVRTNQPWPFQLARWRERGIRTVLNLRGPGRGASFRALEGEACERLGLNLVDFQVWSRAAPSCEQVLKAKALFDALEYPVLMHCKSGADRAGMMSVLYAHFRLGQPIGEALRWLSLRYLHVRHAKTGVIDYAFEKYVREVEPRGISYVDWVQSAAYDPERLMAEYRPPRLVTPLAEMLLNRE